MKKNKKKKQERIDIYEVNNLSFLFIIKSFYSAFISVFSSIGAHKIYYFITFCLFFIFGYSALAVYDSLDVNVGSELISSSFIVSSGVWGFIYPATYLFLFFWFFSYFCFIERKKIKGFLIFLNPLFYLNISVYICIFLLFLWIALGVLENNIPVPMINFLNLEEIVSWFMYDLSNFHKIILLSLSLFIFIMFYVSSFLFVLYFYFSFIKKMRITESLYKSLQFLLRNPLLVVFIIFMTILILGLVIYLNVTYGNHWSNVGMYLFTYLYLLNFYALILKNTIKKFKI